MNQTDSATRPPATDPDDVIDKWYRALDQRELTIGRRPWRALVSGIHADGRDIWIQLSHADNPEESLVLRVSRSTSVDAAIAATRTWAPARTHPRAIDATKQA